MSSQDLNNYDNLTDDGNIQIVNIEHVEAKDNKGIDYEKLISKCFDFKCFLLKKLKIECCSSRSRCNSLV